MSETMSDESGVKTAEEIVEDMVSKHRFDDDQSAEEASHANLSCLQVERKWPMEAVRA